MYILSIFPKRTGDERRYALFKSLFCLFWTSVSPDDNCILTKLLLIKEIIHLFKHIILSPSWHAKPFWQQNILFSKIIPYDGYKVISKFGWFLLRNKPIIKLKPGKIVNENESSSLTFRVLRYNEGQQAVFVHMISFNKLFSKSSSVSNLVVFDYLHLLEAKDSCLKFYLQH